MGPPALFTIPVLRYMIYPVAPRRRGPQGRASDEAREAWVPAFAGRTK
jgi:hypothetical protein